MIVGRAENHSKSAIGTPSADMNSEIHFQDIFALEDNLHSPRIGILVSSYVVQAEPNWKSHPGFESISILKTLMMGHCPNAVLNILGKLVHGNAALGDRLHISPQFSCGLMRPRLSARHQPRQTFSAEIISLSELYVVCLFTVFASRCILLFVYLLLSNKSDTGEK